MSNYPLITNVDYTFWEKKAPRHVIDEYSALFEQKDTIVIVGGDSFTHGDELGDDLISGWPGFGELGTIVRYWHSVKSKIASSPENHDLFKQILHKDRTLSWPMQLQLLRPELLVINLGRSGASPARTVRVMIEWATSIRNKFPTKKVHMIAGMSGHIRTEVLTKYGPINYLPSTDKLEHLVDFNLTYRKLYIEHIDTKALIAMFVKELVFLISVSEKLQYDLLFTTNFYVQDGINRDLSLWNEISDPFNDLFLKKYWPGILMLNHQDISEYSDKKLMCPGGHYAPIVHAKFAEKISKLL